MQVASDNCGFTACRMRNKAKDSSRQRQASFLERISPRGKKTTLVDDCLSKKCYKELAM